MTDAAMDSIRSSRTWPKIALVGMSRKHVISMNELSISIPQQVTKSTKTRWYLQVPVYLKARDVLYGPGSSFKYSDRAESWTRIIQDDGNRWLTCEQVAWEQMGCQAQVYYPALHLRKKTY